MSIIASLVPYFNKKPLYDGIPNQFNGIIVLRKIIIKKIGIIIMKIAIVYFSHTGHTHRFVNNLKKHISADIIRLTPVRHFKRPNIFRYFHYAFLTAKNTYAKLEPYTFNSNKYDHLIFVTPVWIGKLPPAMNTFLRDNKIDCDMSVILSCFVEFDFILENMENKKLKGKGSIRDSYVIYDCKKESNKTVLSQLLHTLNDAKQRYDETTLHAESLY